MTWTLAHTNPLAHRAVAGWVAATTLGLSGTALASPQNPGDDDDSESGVICVVSATSSTGTLFQYELHGAGEIGPDGSLTWGEGYPLLDVWMTTAAGKTNLISDFAPEYSDGGMGHAYYFVPQAYYKLELDVSHLGHSFAVRHQISLNETLDTSYGVCLQPD